LALAERFFTAGRFFFAADFVERRRLTAGPRFVARPDLRAALEPRRFDAPRLAPVLRPDFPRDFLALAAIPFSSESVVKVSTDDSKNRTPR